MLLTHPDSGPHHPTPIPRVGIEDVRAAAARIGPYVRRTPPLAAAEREGLTYVHPFADRRVIAGQGTVALELLDRIPRLA